MEQEAVTKLLIHLSANLIWVLVGLLLIKKRKVALKVIGYIALTIGVSSIIFFGIGIIQGIKSEPEKNINVIQSQLQDGCLMQLKSDPDYSSLKKQGLSEQSYCKCVAVGLVDKYQASKKLESFSKLPINERQAIITPIAKTCFREQGFSV